MRNDICLFLDEAKKTRDEIIAGESNPGFMYGFVKNSKDTKVNIIDQSLKNVFKTRINDIVIVNRLKFVPLLKFIRRKVILININSNHDLDYISGSGLKKFILRKYYLFSYKVADRIICLSPTQVKKLEELGLNNLSVTPLGCDEDLIKRYKASKVGDYYLSAGFDEGKNFKFLERAIGKKKLIVLNKSNKVSYSEYLKLMARCRGFVLNIKHSARSSDLSGITTCCEALLLDKPVFINNQPWLKKLLRKNYHIYESEEDLRNLIGENTTFVKMNKKHLTLSNFNKKLLEIIDELR
ncbi:hypothetical protein HN747_02960 [archaeon]|jgi:hypothetical protein|nr:hypothetical protein [archaeon]